MTDLDLTRSGDLRRRNERLLLLVMACYAVLIGALLLRNPTSITPDVVVVAIALAGLLMLRGRTRLSDWIPILALLLAYELMRGLADDAGFPLHMADIIEAERLLFLGALPTQVLQEALRPVTGFDWVAFISTAVYMVHFLIPIFTGVLLWKWRRGQFHDYIAALVVLSMAGFTTFLLLPAAPPWYAANAGLLNGADGLPAVANLKPETFADIGAWLGVGGSETYETIFYTVGPNDVAAWPSLHAAYPFLAFLALRRAFGRIAWLVAVYALVVAFAVVYVGDHWVHDAIAGFAYAYISYYVVVHTPPVIRRWFDRVLRLGPWSREPGAATSSLGESE